MDPLTLDPASLRVLGALMEKEMTTPENYPLSLNGLSAAANQKTSRDPIMDLSEEQVRHALDILDAHALVTASRESRVPKYEHRIRTVLTLRRDETAVLCVLLLRGPQTAGELRSRTDRMHTFDDIAAVQATLDRLAAREVPLVTRIAGTREARAMHLLGDSTALPEPAPRQDDLAALRDQIAALTTRVDALEARLTAS